MQILRRNAIFCYEILYKKKKVKHVKSFIKLLYDRLMTVYLYNLYLLEVFTVL